MLTGAGLDRYLVDDEPARWAVACIQQLCGDDLPEYGSPEWLQSDRARQVAAAIRAAEAYRRAVLFLPQALADDLAARRRLLDEDDTRAYAELVDRLEHFDRYDAAWWQEQASTPTHAELVERRSA